jgi:hypothetical protein
MPLAIRGVVCGFVGGQAAEWRSGRAVEVFAQCGAGDLADGALLSPRARVRSAGVRSAVLRLEAYQLCQT